MKLRLKGVYRFRDGYASLWFNVMTSSGLNKAQFSMWYSMLDMVCYLSLLMFAEGTHSPHPRRDGALYYL